MRQRMIKYISCLLGMCRHCSTIFGILPSISSWLDGCLFIMFLMDRQVWVVIEWMPSMEMIE